MRRPKSAPKKKPRKVCRCHGVSQRVSVVTGAGGGAPAPVVHQVGVPMQAPTVPPQFMFPVSNGIGDPRFAAEREKVRRDDHHYDRVGSAGRIETTSRMTQSDTADVTRENMTPLERFRAGQQGEINVSILELTKNQLVDRVVALRLETQRRARQMTVDQLRGMLEAHRGQ